MRLTINFCTIMAKRSVELVALGKLFLSLEKSLLVCSGGNEWYHTASDKVQYVRKGLITRDHNMEMCS